VDEGGVDDAVGCRSTAAQAVEVLQGPVNRFGAGCDERGCSFLRASETEHLMAVCEQFSDNSGADKAGGSRDEDAHVMFSRLI
jgi:hypothetical protein